MTNEISPALRPTALPAKPASPIPSPSVTIYSLDIIGLHGKGFIIPTSPADAVERISSRFGTGGLAIGASVTFLTILTLSACLLIVVCDLLSTIAELIMP